MKYLLDTNVVSEWVKPIPDAKVIEWLDQVDEDRVFLSVISVAELHSGVERLPQGKRKQQLVQWLERDVSERFAERLLQVDKVIAETCGRIIARGDELGRPINAIDAFIAATAVVHDLTLVTRNQRHFSAVMKHIFNPWSTAP